MIHKTKVMERNCSNKIELLCELKMMESNWSAWTWESYASTMLGLSDNEITSFMEKSDDEITEIQEEVNKYFYEKVKE